MVEDPYWPRAQSLLKAPSALGEIGDAPYAALIGCPLSKPSISPSNAHETPQALRNILLRFATFAAGVGPDGDLHIDLEDTPLVDFGDLDIAALESEPAQAQLEALTREIVGKHKPALTLLAGGDNAVTRGGMKATCPDLSRAGLITFDAHHDTRDYYNGPSNGTPVRGLIDDGLPGNRIAQIGIGTFTNSRHYRNYCEENGITLYGMTELHRRGVTAVLGEALDRLAAECETIYVDLDIDVLDRAFVPGCPGARPGGMLPADLHLAAFIAGRHPKVAAIDFTEVDSTADVNDITVQNMGLCVLNALAGFAARK